MESRAVPRLALHPHLTAMGIDRVLADGKPMVLEESRIAERGNHQDLLAKNGIYAELYRRQQLEEELEAS